MDEEVKHLILELQLRIREEEEMRELEGETLAQLPASEGERSRNRLKRLIEAEEEDSFFDRTIGQEGPNETDWRARKKQRRREAKRREQEGQSKHT